MKPEPSQLKFNGGSAPLSPNSISKQYLSSTSCKECHSKEYSEWENSMHKKSYSNRLFLSALQKDNQSWCINCHTPLDEQSKNFIEIGNGKVIKIYKKSELLDEGINCSVCHVRDETIYTSKIPGISSILKSPHKLSYDPYLKSPEFCAGCHEFPFPKNFDPITFSNSPMQSTYTEWKHSGESRTCQGCHFARGNHSLPGPHTKGFIQSNLDLKFNIINTPMDTFAVIINFSFQKIGHNFITGDLFRTVNISIFDEKKNLIRNYLINRNVNIGSRKIESDTLIKERDSNGKLNEDIRIQVGQSFPTFCKISYHYQGKIEDILERENLSRSDLNYVIYEGSCGKLNDLNSSP